MKLRLRSLDSKETTKLQLPDSSTLHQLKLTLSQSLPSSPSPSSILLSLNRTHLLLSSSPHDSDSLLSLGITSGDLIYFSFASSQQPIFDQSLNSQNSQSFLPNMPQNEEPTSENFRESSVEESFVQSESVEEMVIDSNDDRVSEPYFLRRVLRKELESGDVDDLKLLVVAVHAVFLESGFVGFDSVSGLRIDGFQLADEWPTMAVSIKLVYTLPELLESGSVKESVLLKFQSLGRFVNVYGSLAKGGSGLYRVCLDKNKFAEALNVAWRNCKIDDGSSSRLDLEKDVFEFWKVVKDGLALPLLIDLCDKTGLALPPCLMRLPAELKFKILESLPGVDVSRMGCVCSEMKYLSSIDDLWKQKVTQEFKIASRSQKTWKLMYAMNWQINRKVKRIVDGRRQRVNPMFRPRIPIVRDPDPLRFPSPIIGGDYDLLPGGPGLGFPAPFGQPSGTYGRRRLNFSPNCNLGGFSG